VRLALSKEALKTHSTGTSRTASQLLRHHPGWPPLHHAGAGDDEEPIHATRSRHTHLKRERIPLSVPIECIGIPPSPKAALIPRSP